MSKSVAPLKKMQLLLTRAMQTLHLMLVWFCQYCNNNL